MAVAFNYVPGDERVPLFYAEVNPGIPPYSGVSRTLLIGRKLAAGTAVVGKPVQLGGGDPTGQFGAGAMLTDMAVFARWRNQTGALWVLPVADPVGGVAASGTIAFAGAATAAGTFTRYVAGERYDTVVAYGDSAASVATNFAATLARGYSKYNRRMLAPVTAAAVTGTVTLTARHTGVEGNMIRIDAGLDGNELDVPGITADVTPIAGGQGIVDLGAALAGLGNMAFDWVAGPYNSPSQLAAATTFFADSGSGRWSPTIGLDGHYITAFDGNLSAQTVLGAGLNDRHQTVLGLQSYPHPLWSWVAALAGLVGFSKNLGRSLTEAIEIARPLQTVPLEGLRGPFDPSLRWALPDRDALYRNGISAVTFGADNVPVVDRVLTTYQTGPFGVADITFLGIESIAIAAYVKRYFKLQIVLRYPRAVLRDDNPRGLQGVATPDAIKGTIIHAYTDLSETAGVVENVALFSKYLIVERSADPNRVNCYLPVDVANQLIVVASNITIFPQLTDNNASLT